MKGNSPLRKSETRNSFSSIKVWTEEHLDAAQHELGKTDISSMNEEVKKTIEAAREEQKESQQEVAVH